VAVEVGEVVDTAEVVASVVDEEVVAEAEEVVGNYSRNLALRCVYAIPKRFGLQQH
jgi:hypothetical protein